MKRVAQWSFVLDGAIGFPLLAYALFELTGANEKDERVAPAALTLAVVLLLVPSCYRSVKKEIGRAVALTLALLYVAFFGIGAWCLMLSAFFQSQAFVLWLVGFIVLTAKSFYACAAFSKDA